MEPADAVLLERWAGRATCAATRASAQDGDGILRQRRARGGADGRGGLYRRVAYARFAGPDSALGIDTAAHAERRHGLSCHTRKGEEAIRRRTPSALRTWTPSWWWLAIAVAGTTDTGAYSVGLFSGPST